MNTSEKPKVFQCFREEWKENMGLKWINQSTSAWITDQKIAGNVRIYPVKVNNKNRRTILKILNLQQL